MIAKITAELLMIEDLRKKFQKAGLKMNRNKTKIMANRRKYVLEQDKSIKLNKTTPQEMEVIRKLKFTRAAMGRLPKNRKISNNSKQKCMVLVFCIL